MSEDIFMAKVGGMKRKVRFMTKDECVTDHTHHIYVGYKLSDEDRSLQENRFKNVRGKGYNIQPTAYEVGSLIPEESYSIRLYLEVIPF